MKKVILGILAVFAVWLTVSCGPQRAGESRDITIGFSMDSFVVERWQRDRDIFLDRARELGARVIFQNANEDHEVQVRQIQYLAAQKIDVLVVVPNDGDKLTQVIREVRNQGIKVIAYDRLVKNAGVDLYISFDNVKVGRLMAQALVDARPRAQMLIVNGAASDHNSYMLNQGFHEILDTLIEAKKLRIVEEKWLKTWSSEEAVLALTDFLAAKNTFNGLIAANDFLADAMIRVLSERQLLDKVSVVGHDADLSACQRVVEGTQLMTVYKPIDQLARTAAELSIQIARGETPQNADTLSDGTQEIPFVKLEPIPVTRQNMMKTVVKDGFHSLEEVYRHIPKDERPLN